MQEFFPEVNLRKLYEVEGYHKKLASILDGQFAVECDSVQREIEDLQSQVSSVNDQIRELGMVGNLSKEFLDRHSEIKGKIDALKTQNEAYLTSTDLQNARKKADDMLRSAIETILSDIEQAISITIPFFWSLTSRHTCILMNITVIGLKLRTIQELDLITKEW